MRLLAVLVVVAVAVFGEAATADAAPLVGATATYASADLNPAGTAEAFVATAATSGTVGSLSIYLDGSSTATKVTVGLYASSASHPGALLTQGTIATPAAGTWNTVDVPNATVTAGTSYWLAVLGPSGQGTVRFRDQGAGAGAAETSATKTLTTLPAAWSTGTGYRDGPISAYASSTGTAPTPILSVSPTALAFGATQGAANPPAKSLAVANTGAGTLTFTATTDAPWLSATPASGTAPASVQVTATTGSLAAGTYTGHVTVAATGAQGSPATVTVTFTVDPVAPPPPPPPPSGSDWLQIEHDPGRSGFAAGETAITTTNASTLSGAWTTPVDGKVTAAPLYAANVSVGGATHDVVVAATSANSVYALDAGTGAVLWRRNFGSVANNCAIPGGFGITAAPAIDKAAGRIYTVSDDGRLRTIRLADGGDAAAALDLIDRAGTNKVWGGLNLSGGSLYVTTASDGCDSPPWRGQVYRLDVSGAAPQLSKTWAVVPSIPSPGGGGGLWGYGGVSVDVDTGRVYATPGADSTEQYAAYADRMVALSPNLDVLGSFEPSHPTTFPCTGAPCDVDFGATPIVFRPGGCPTMTAAGNKNGFLYLFDVDALATSGQPRQSIQLSPANDWLGSGGVGGVPAYWPDGRMLIVTDAGPGFGGVAGGVVGLHVKADCTLEVAWSQPLGGATQPNSTPTVANGVVYVGEGNGGRVHAYDATSGSELWSGGATTGATYAAPIAAGGKIFAGSWDGFTGGAAGTVRAFAPGATPPPPPPPTGTTLLGTATVQSQVDSNATGVAEAFEATALATGTLSSIKLYLDGASAATKVVAGVYADAGGHPGTLVGQGSTSAPTAGAWNTLSVSSGAIVSGRKYWIAVLGAGGGTVKFRDRAGGSCRAETSAAVGLNVLPASWSSGRGYTDCPLSGYGVG